MSPQRFTIAFRTDPPDEETRFMFWTFLTLLAAPSAQATDFVVPAGETVVYDTATGPLRARDVLVEEGGTLRVVGDRPFVLRALGTLDVQGVIDLSGDDARDVATLNTGNIPEIGARGGPGGGVGGTGSAEVTTSTPAGGSGEDAAGLPVSAGGESGFASATLGVDARRPGGGAGGVLAADAPESDDPADPANAGLIAEPGVDGSTLATGAVFGATPPAGGALGSPVFVDDDPGNDFWGLRPDGQGGLIVGELAFPVAGVGGGAGGDAVPGTVFPQPNWSPATDEKGGAGGGGGGLGAMLADSIVVGPLGAIRADGGGGGNGENTNFFNALGGNGGGGSGGYLVLRARTIDLSAAGPNALSARGGPGAIPIGVFGPTPGNGGSGGPGVIQLHTPRAQGIVLPAAGGLASVSAPDAWSLLQ